ncbi:MAG: hypothetical protein QM736_00650 [Vicinamibacterales bacterium]
MRSLPIVAVLLVTASSVTAQPHSENHGVPVLTVDALTRPIALRVGIGTAHDRASARLSPDVQPYYDQGLALLHNYVWLDAARSFNQVLRLAPQTPLAQIGLSYAYDALNLRSLARQQLDAAATGAASPHDRAHVELRQLEMQAEDAPADRSRQQAYRNALDRTLAIFPGDGELWLLRGMAEAAAPGDRGQGSTSASIPYFTHARELAPDDVAAHHYLAHACENSGDFPCALDAAGRYAARASAVPHAHHMVGHDLRRTGHIADAIAAFERADDLQRAYVKAEGMPAEIDWHYEHNLDLLGTSYQYVGRIRRASQLLQAGFDIPSANLVQIVNKRQWPLLLRLSGQTDDAMTAARWFIAHANTVVQAIGHIEAAHVLMMRGHLAEAADDANEAVALLKTRPPGGALADVPLRLLQGEFLLRQGQRHRAEPLLRSALADARRAQGPDEWAQTLFMLEWVAAVARDVGAWDLAETLAHQMLEHDGAYGGSHYAMALVEEHLGHHLRADAEFREARARWADADPDFGPRRIIDAALTPHR